MGWFDFLKEKYILVKTIDMDIVVNNPYVGKREGKLYLYLYESKSGKRKYEHKYSIDNVGDDLKNISDFQLKIYPWLNGVSFSDIPSYLETIRKDKKRYVRQLYLELLKK